MHMIPAIWLAPAGLLVAAFSWATVGMVRHFALRWNIVDVANERSSHRGAMPVGGGLAVVVLNLVAWAIFGFIHPMLSFQHALVLLSGGSIVALVGWIDDMGHVPYPIRLAVQGLVGALFIAGYAYWHQVNVPVIGTIGLGIVGVPLTFFWIVGLTNSYNFMDGIDGMAGGMAVAGGLGWVVLGTITDHPILAAMGVLITATSAGFLVHNWHPASIFMGDVGSTFLGYSFAVMPVIAARYDPRLALAGVLLVWPAVFDPAFTVLRRLYHRQSIFVGHKTFLFHRLVHAGWSQSSAAFLYFTLPILGGVLAITWEYGTREYHSFLAITLATFCVGLWLLVRRQEKKGVVADVRADRVEPVPELSQRVREAVVISTLEDELTSVEA
jgi:UDP-N-acetylmuramyl pentapeptide phosphotransferase/UDP-N-acetylglucosamine-1-phosphate transferase